MSVERWRRPVIPIRIEHVPQGIWLPDGRIMGDVRMVFREEDIERMRAGYVCVKCLEPHEHAWPERCSICGSPMRTAQAEFFAKWYDAKPEIVRMGVDWASELESLDERRREAEEVER